MSDIRRPIIKPYDKDRFELVEDYHYSNVIVPKGYRTNGADIPRILWSIFPPNSPEYLSAVVVHDYLCDKGSTGLADAVLKTMMSELGVAKWKVALFYYSVRAYHIVRYGRDASAKS